MRIKTFLGRAWERGRATFPLRKRWVLLILAAKALVLLLVMLALAGARSTLLAPEPTLLIEDRHHRFLSEVERGEPNAFGYWRLEELPPRVVAATLALEDRRFWSHPGVDPLAVARAAWQNVSTGRRISGASTVAMQVARLQNPGPRTYFRKAVESLTAIALTLRYGREAVLAHYLSIVPYGNRIHGIAYAARCYFDKPVEDLSWAEIAILTALPQAPGRMNLYVPAGRRRAEERGKRILSALRGQSVISREEYELAMEQIVRLRIPLRGRRPAHAMHAVLRLDETFRRLGDDSQRPKSNIVHTTLDLDIQEEVAWMAYTAVKDWERRGAGNAAVIVLERPTNEVLAWVGSIDYFDPDHAGAIDYTNVPRLAGSTLKPFLYSLALERGVITPATILADLPRGASGLTNADKIYVGPLLPRAALANSRNVPAVHLLESLGLDRSYALFHELSLHENTRPARHYGLGLAIGALPVTLEQLVRAYTVLSGDGHLGDLVWYRGQPHSRPHRIFSENTVRQVSLFLSDPMARLPTFPRMGWSEYPFPVAVKTGTSSDYRDAWAVGYSPRYVVGVWVGHPDYRPMNRLSGYRAAARLVQKVMRFLHRDQTDGLDDLSFPPPRGYRPLRVCTLTGKRAGRACERVSLEWFAPGQEPVETCSAHVQMVVDTRNGLLATSETPAESTEVRTFFQPPARFAEWAVSAGLPLPPSRISRWGGRHQEPSARRTASPIEDRVSASVHITSPTHGIELFRDPETPPEMATLALRAVVEPPSQQLLWYVNGIPFELAAYPYTARWRLEPGEHVFQARIPNTPIASNVVRIRVQ
jgi:penicillin-binding protein 1C